MRVLVDVTCPACGAVEEELLRRRDLPGGQVEWEDVPPCACGGARVRGFGKTRVVGVSPTKEVKLSDGTVVTTNAQMRQWQAENPTARQVHPGTAEDRMIRRATEKAIEERAARSGLGVGAMRERNRRAWERRQEGKR